MTQTLRRCMAACILALYLPLTQASDPGALQAAKDMKYELVGMAAAITYFGVQDWNWGNSGFSFNDEGWFGMDTGSGGADKLGHLYSTYALSDFLIYRLTRKSGNARYGATYGALFSWGTMVVVEVFDGFSSDHGFSYEDLIMNSAGVGVSYLRSTVPGLKDKLDLRIEYEPSEGMDGIHPITDYSGMKYLAALKLSGFEGMRDTPLKYLELQMGYYTRGFQDEDLPYFPERETHLYVGVGLNLEQVLFQHLPDNRPVRYTNTFFKYYQMPFTAAEWDIDERR